MAWEHQRNTPSRAVGLGAACLLALFLLLPVQVVSAIAFEATGLDAVAPDLVFVVIVPALVVAMLPAAVARRLYSGRASRLTLSAAFLVAALVATLLRELYGLCGGPGC